MRSGDVFFPLGMRNKKKVSDFMIDEKIPFFLKKNVRVMTSAGKIVWVVGRRIDERFAVKDRNARVLKYKIMYKRLNRRVRRWVKSFRPASYGDYEQIESLKRSVIFKDLCPLEMEEVAALMHVRTYTKHEAIFLKGEPAQAVYLIVEGRVRISTERLQQEEDLFTLEVDDTLGHEALLSESTRQTHAIVVSESATVYAIPQGHLLEAMQMNISIEAKIMRNLSLVYNKYIHKLFSQYKEDTGFFELAQVRALF